VIVVVGRIMRAAAAPEATPWMWTLAFGHHEDRTPTHGYEPTREAGMSLISPECPQSGGRPDNICSLRVFLSLTDTVEKRF
jgi:hypothetical protein